MLSSLYSLIKGGRSLHRALPVGLQFCSIPDTAKSLTWHDSQRGRMEEGSEQEVFSSNFEENPTFEGEYADVDRLRALSDRIKLSLRSIGRNVIAEHRLRRAVDAFISPGRRSFSEDSAAETTEAVPLLYTQVHSYTSPNHASVQAAYEAFVEEIDKAESHYLAHQKDLEVRYKALLKAHRAATSAKQEDFKAEFVELYRQCFFLREFSLLNYSKLLTLISEHFRLRNTFLARENERMDINLQRYLHSKQFSKGKATKHISKQICKTFADFFCNGNIAVANMRLLAKRHEDLEVNSCRVGVWAGMSLLSAVWFCFDILVYSDRPDIHDSGGARVFRLLRFALIMYLGICCQIYAWRQSRVNFPFIFKIKSDDWPRNSTLFLVLGRVSTLYFLMHLAYIKGSQKELRLFPPLAAAYMAFALAVVSLAVAVIVIWNLIPRAQSNTLLARFVCFWRSIFLAVIGQNNRAFFTAYISDYMTSSSKVLQDLSLLLCDMSSPDRVQRMLESSDTCANRLILVIPVIMIIPISIRMIQNIVRLHLTRKHWPFLPNALKYASAHTIVIYSTLYPSLLLSPFGICAIFLLSTATFVWDVKVDWGLGKTEYRFLRKRLMLRRKEWYYFAIGLDFVMRYFWTLTLIPKFNTEATWLLVITAFSTELELIRRGFWGVLRVENEHLNNTRGFRHVKFTPLYFDKPPPPAKEANGVSYPIMCEITSITVVTFSLAIAAILWYE